MMSSPDASSDMAPEPLIQRLRDHVATRPDATAYLEINSDGSSGRRLSYAQLLSRIDGLADELGKPVKPVEVVLIQCSNTLDFPVAFLAALSARYVALLMSPQCAEAELSNAMDTAGVSIILREKNGSLIAPRRDSPGVPLTEPGLILQSSGTTGQPGLVFRSQGAVDAVSRQMADAIHFGPQDRVLCAIPLCHSYGIEHGLLAPIYAGSSVHLCPGMNLPAMMRQLCEDGITIFPGTPSIYEMLSQAAEPGAQLPTLRAAYSAGSPLPRAVFDAFEDRFQVRIGQLYGATEVGSVTYNDPRASDFDPASVGGPMDQVQIRIAPLDDPSGELKAGEEGQVCIRAASMLSCYLGRESSPLHDGFFLTADLGRLDAKGNLTITGRQKLLIDVGGLKVNPIEVEEVLMRHPDVRACVIVPVRQSHTLFRLKAVITPRFPERPPSVEALRDFARRSLAPYKVPRLYEFRASLPRTATGKILRNAVCAVLLCIVLLSFTAGCAHQPPLPTYSGISDAAALDVLARRAQSVHTMSGQGSLELTQSDGQSIRLEAAVAMRPPDHVRLRAWKFNQAVLDLTILPQGVWIVAPAGGKRKEQILSSSARAAEFAKAWALFTLFGEPEVTATDQGGQLLIRQQRSGHPTIICHVDRRTLTPRRYEIYDESGALRFSLDLDKYAEINGIVWPGRMTAIGPDGKIVLDLRDLELNSGIPSGAFIPPAGAQRLP
jgi:acyl-CoA synthetase (AMP-forming)/AMP-acid ligase II/outer membrane lipoprotein-sorting protein